MTFTFSLTSDLDLVREIIVNPRCYRRMVNDRAPRREDFKVETCSLDFIIAEVDGQPAAVFLLATEGYAPGVAEVHFCFSPAYWGGTVKISKAFVEWIWRETSIYRLVGPVPDYNRTALKLAKAVGFTPRETVDSRNTKNGKAFSLLVMEMDNPAHTRVESKRVSEAQHAVT